MRKLCSTILLACLLLSLAGTAHAQPGEDPQAASSNWLYAEGNEYTF